MVVLIIFTVILPLTKHELEYCGLWGFTVTN